MRTAASRPVDYRIEGRVVPSDAELRAALDELGVDVALPSGTRVSHGAVLGADQSAAAAGGLTLRVVGGADSGRRLVLNPGISWIGRGP